MNSSAFENDDSSVSLSSQDESFQELLKQITETTVSWQHFLDMRTPRGATVESTWRTIHEINRSAGSVLPDFYPGATVFYRYSMEMVDSFYRLLLTLLKIASKEVMSDFENNRTFYRDTVRDTVCAAALDGLEVSEDAVVQVLEGKLSNPAPEVRLAANAVQLLMDINASSADIVLDLDLLKGTYQAITQGVDLAALPSHRPIITCLVPHSANEACTEPVFDERAQLAMDYLAGKNAERTDLGIMRHLLAPTLLNSFVPLAGLATLVGAVISRIAVVTSGIPLLGKLSMLYARYRWETSPQKLDGVSFTPTDVVETQQQEERLNMYDITLIQTVTAQLGLIQAQKLLRYADFFSRQSEEVRRSLLENSWFNSRQRNILARAAKGRNRRFTIRYHQENHNISYATARRDFQELLDAGYLDSVFEGKTQVFMASENLLDMLSVHADLLDEEHEYFDGFMTTN